MLNAWMAEKKSTNWSVGLHFVQLQKNSALNRGIGRSPYEAAFGKSTTIGLSSEATIPAEVLALLVDTDIISERNCYVRKE